MTRLVRIALTASAALLLAEHPIVAQGKTVAASTVQGLGFGRLIPGLAETVSPTDAWRRAEVRLDGSGPVDVRVILPSVLTAPGGATIPLTFRMGDGGWTRTVGGTLKLFDPNVTERITIPAPAVTAWVYIGGTATPAPSARAGDYTATITIVISTPGT